jgi:D-alanyl-lipoteichoic acid acyltransferase DltB (MBOAT superfamily)
MLFNSLDFAVFLPLVFMIYWFVLNRNLRIQNSFLVLASYLFYGWWDWRFLILILFSTVVDFSIGIWISNTKVKRHRKLLLAISILVNIGFLGFFKYYNFFIDNFTEAFSFFGVEIHGGSLDIILPMGISFYTLQTLSYTIDVYRNKIDATRNFVSFSAYVSFFPQLVAGPIERASNLLPQFSKQRSFEYETATDGMRQILWGLFKKVVIADNCAEYVDYAFSNSGELSGITLAFGALLFTFQIYGDFSGYSDIAIGTARLFGFRLKQNFAFPYFSKNMAEFWRRWHISLSTWFRDYVYLPLGGSRDSQIKVLRNVFIIFLVSGFWHGANWTFLFWGALNALYVIPAILMKRHRRDTEIVAPGQVFASPLDLVKILSTFILAVFAWIFFRADNIEHAFSYINCMFTSFNGLGIESTLEEVSFGSSSVILIIIMIAVEWLGRENKHALESLPIPFSRGFRWTAYALLVLIIFYAGNFGENTFIYFQF